MVTIFPFLFPPKKGKKKSRWHELEQECQYFNCLIRFPQSNYISYIDSFYNQPNSETAAHVTLGGLRFIITYVMYLLLQYLNRGKGGKDPTASTILYERPPNSDWLTQISVF